jgi:hypothetical protein
VTEKVVGVFVRFHCAASPVVTPDDSVIFYKIVVSAVVFSLFLLKSLE